jgi:exodeoxyribonuclease VII small subunit
MGGRGYRAWGMSDKADKAEKAEKPIDFEKSIARLSKIVQELEGGELPLEQSLALFEEGVRVSRSAQQRLDAAERRIEELLSVTDTGKARTKPLAHDD